MSPPVCTLRSSPHRWISCRKPRLCPHSRAAQVRSRNFRATLPLRRSTTTALLPSWSVLAVFGIEVSRNEKRLPGLQHVPSRALCTCVCEEAQHATERAVGQGAVNTDCVSRHDAIALDASSYRLRPLGEGLFPPRCAPLRPPRAPPCRALLK